MLTSQILVQLIIILLAVQLFGYLCKLIGQPQVIGEILAGLALGPTLLGVLLPHVETLIFPDSVMPTLQTLGDIGLVLYMFSLGTHIDTHAMLRQSRKAVVVSLSGIILPLIMGGILASFLYPQLAGPIAQSATSQISFMLLVGTVMAITAFPVLARLLSERNMLTTPIGTLSLTCAAIDDVLGWCLLAFVIAIIHTNGLLSVAITLGLLTLFIVVMLVLVRPLLLLAHQHIQSKTLLMVLTIVLLLLSAYVTDILGIHPVFGAFLMGVILPRRTSFLQPVQSIEQINYLLFLPLYFVYSGLRTHLGLINSPALWLICLLALLVACISKILGGTLSLKALGESWKEAFTLGTLMNTRGLVELIVLNIGLDTGVLSPSLFAMLVIMTIVTTMMAPWLLPLLGYRQKAGQKKWTTRPLEDQISEQTL